MWPFKKTIKLTPRQEKSESLVQEMIKYAATARIEDTRNPGLQVSLMQLRLWGFNAEVDRILPRLPSEARQSLGSVDFFIMPLARSPSPALAARAVAARPEVLSRDQVERLQQALSQWLSR